MRYHVAVVLALAAVLACGGSPQTRQLRDAVQRTVEQPDGDAVAFRFASRRGGNVRLYRLPGLDPVTWSFETPGLVTHEVVGSSSDEDRIFLLDPEARLVVLDLEAGRARTVDSGITAATVNRVGAVLYARDTAFVGLAGRSPEMWAAHGGTPIRQLAGAARRQLAAVTGETGERELVVVSSQGGSRRQRIPDGPVAFSPWGELAAIATDTGIVVVHVLRDEPAGFLELEYTVRDVVFSASGHRLYATTDAGLLLEIERFDLTLAREIPLSSGAARLRIDPMGRVVLVQDREDEAVWIVPAVRDTTPRKVSGGWDPDLPTVSPDGTLLLRRGADVVALDLASLAERGRLQGAGTDRWLVVPWDPRRPVLQLAERAPEAAARDTVPGQRLYVQVSSTTNPAWADDLARDLRLAGVRANVLPPDGVEEMYRVVVGPFPTRQEAEAAGRQLGMPFWIFTQQPAPAAPGVP